MLRWTSAPINPDPLDMLWHIAHGAIACFPSGEQSQVRWVKYTHRGVQFLDKIAFPRKEKRYIFSPDFEIRYNQAFDEVVLACADPGRDENTWLIPELIEGYGNLHRLGFAHSYEAWQGGKLVGGAFGVQIGGFISCESMFHRVSNASKAAWGQTLLRLKERGFAWIDTNSVAEHHVNYGEEWLPQWKFERLLRQALGQRRCLGDEMACPMLPWPIRGRLALTRLAGALGRRVAASI